MWQYVDSKKNTHHQYSPHLHEHPELQRVDVVLLEVLIEDVKSLAELMFPDKVLSISVADHGKLKQRQP